MSHVSDLLRALDRVAAQHNWTVTQLASFMGVHRSVLVHARGGRRVLTTQALAHLALTFPDRADLKDLVWAYLQTEVLTGPDVTGRLRLPPARGSSGLAPSVREPLRRYVRSFPKRYFEGRSLALVGDAAEVISRATDFACSLLTDAGLPVPRRQARERLRESEVRELVQARVLVLDRVEFASETTRSLLHERATQGRPTVVSTACPIDQLPGGVAADLGPRCVVVRLVTPPASDE